MSTSFLRRAGGLIFNNIMSFCFWDAMYELLITIISFNRLGAGGRPPSVIKQFPYLGS